MATKHPALVQNKAPLTLSQGNGYDYKNQAWIVGGKYARCGHPESMDCRCFGRIHEGEQAPVIDEA